MEEAIEQLAVNSLEYSKRKSVGPSGQITVTMDTRSLAPDHRVFYRNLHKFRVSQMNDGVDLTGLSDEQWGMVQLDKCHHISTTSTSKDGPQSFRVRICKTCCQEDSHIELGTYVDQESAILVNDTFEILNERLDRLIVLRVEDKSDLQHLVAKKYDRSKGRDYACILDLISERIAAIEGKKRKPSASEMIPAFAKRSGELAPGVTAGDAHSSTQYSSCSTSSEASDELRTASRLSGAKNLTHAGSHTSLHSSLPGSASRPTLVRRPSSTSARKLSIGSAQDYEAASNSGSASTIDDDISVTEETSSALRELSSVCYARLLSPSINPTVPGSAHLTPGTVLTGTSLFGGSTTGTADLVRSLEMARMANSNISSVTNSTGVSTAVGVGERLNLGSPYSSSSTATAPLLGGESPPVNAALSMSAPSSNATQANTGSHNKRSRTAVEESAELPSGAQSNDRLAGLEGQTPRKRAATFSVSEPYPYHYNYNADHGGSSGSAHNPIATLTWLASMEECEVDVARSLFELRGNTEIAASLFDSRPSGGHSRSDALSMALGLGAGGVSSAYGSYMHMGMNMSYDQHEDEYYDQDGEDGEEGENDEDEELDGEDYYHLRHMASGGGKAGGKPIYGFPSTYPHNGKLYQQAGVNAGPARMRSSSMSMIDRSEAAWAILGSSGGYRSKMDPLSMALKKYHERGGSANAAASGFVGIYSPEDRKQRILRFLEKRKRRMWTKKVKYDVRKNFADSRVRVKGRFVKKQDEDDGGDGGGRLNTSGYSHSSFEGDVGGDAADAQYDHTDVDLELLDQLNAQHVHRDSGISPRTQPQDTSGDGEKALNLRLKVSAKNTPGGSGSATSSSTKKKAEVVKSEVKAESRSSDLKFTISSSRRRRNSRAEDADTSAELNTSADSADAHSSPSNVALRLERANLNSAEKPPAPL